MQASGEQRVESVERARVERVLAAWDATIVVGSIEHLSGLTNRIFKVAAGDVTVVVRLPGLGTDAYIDRRAELHNARIMSVLGIGATILHAADGALVTRFLPGRVLSPEILRDDPAVLDQVARLLGKVHASTEPFASEFNPFVVIAGYRAGLAEVPAGTDDLIERLGRLAAPARLVPCHHDPWPENFVETATGLRLLDWEYSAMGDPAWDLADVVVEAALDPAATDQLLVSYSGGSVDPVLRARVDDLAPVTDLLWGLWALVQHRDGNGVMDYAAYGRNRIERAGRPVEPRPRTQPTTIES